MALYGLGMSSRLGWGEVKWLEEEETFERLEPEVRGNEDLGLRYESKELVDKSVEAFEGKMSCAR